MDSFLNELRNIFERSLKWKLSQKAKTTADEFKILMNNFRYYDYNPSGQIDKEQWKQVILKIGLISLSEEKLNKLYDYYLSKQNLANNNNSHFLDYKQFSYYLLYNTLNPPNLKKRNNYLNGNNNSIKRFNYSYDFSKNNDYISKDNNKYNSKININISNKQNRNKFYEEIEENKDINNNYTNNLQNNNILNDSKRIIDINDNNNINLKYFIKNVIDIFRKKVNKDNGVTFYTLLQKIKLNMGYDQNSDILSLSKLNLILKESNLNFTQKELQSLFCIIDFNDRGYISINKFLRVIKGYLNDFRKQVLIYIFQKQIDIHKNGKISIYYFKELYNAKNHPDVLNKKINESEAKTQFNYTFDIYCKLYKIYDEINCSQFIKYYEGISPSIPNDLYFQEIINNVWKRTSIFDETYFPSINNKNINFNLEKKFHRNVSSPLMSFNNNKEMNTSESMSNYNNSNFISKNNNLNERNNNLLNSNYLEYKNNTLNTSLNNNRITLKRVNLTPINNYQKYTPPLILNDIQNNNMYNYKQKNNDINKYKSLNLSKTPNINSITHNNTNKYFPPKKYSYPKINKSSNIVNEESNKIGNKDKFAYSQIILNSLRNFLVRRGNKSIFYLQRMLTNCDRGQNGLISLDQLNKIFRAYNFNIYFYDIKLLFELFDKNKIGFIQFDHLIKAIVGVMNERRQKLIIKVYDNLNKDLYGYINIKEIKNKYNCYKHPEVIKGNKTHEEVYGDFLECLEIYREYVCNINKKYNDFLAYDEFLEFYNELSMYIKDDNYFEILICGCWDIK